MQKVGGVVQSKGGRVVVGAVIQFYLAGTTTPATMYSDAQGTKIIPAGQLKSDNEGEYGAYVANGRYDIKELVQGRIDGEYLDVLVYDPGDIRLDAGSLVGNPGWDDVPALGNYTPLNAQSQALLNRFELLDSEQGSSRVGFTSFGSNQKISLEKQLRGSGQDTPIRRGFWSNDASGVNIHRFRDRLFVGESVKHTGRGAAPYGATWLASKVATWPEKNAQVSMLSSEEKIGVLAGVQATNASGASAIGIASFSYNERTSGTARAIYADVTHTGLAGASYGVEIAVNNTGVDVQSNAYSLPGGVIGLHCTPEGGSGYTLGDSDTAATIATAPGTVAINIGAGSGGTVNKRWNLGLRFGSNALTGSDGVTGTAIAIGMAKGHTIEWRASNGMTGAQMRSDVTAVAGQDVGLLFENNAVSVKGTAFGPNIVRFNAVASAVNYILIINAVAGGYPIVKPEGSDVNLGIFFDTKGNAPHRFRTNGGLNEQLRVSHVANSVNFLNISGSVSGAPPQISVAGQDSDIDLLILPKNGGKVKFGDLVASADASVTGYILIKDNSGAIRKLAVIT